MSFCPKLWNEVYIDQIGRVFACCHGKPEPFGNIYERSLREIYAGVLANSRRQQSESGGLSCYKYCTLLDKTLPESNVRRVASDYNYEDLEILHVLFGESCNIACTMCWQDHKDRVQLDYDTLLKNVDLSPFKKILIQGGEPLFLKSARRFMDFCFSENRKVGLMTNGLLVDDQIAQKIVDGCYEFCVSINAATKTTHEIVNVGSKWERVLDNIAKIKIRKHQSGSELEIRGHFTIVNSNIHEIPLFIKAFEFLGFEKIDFGFDGTVARLLHRFPNVKSQLTRSITKNIVDHPNSQLIDTKRLRILGLLPPPKLGACCDQ